MYKELIFNLEQQLSSKEISKILTKNIHLGIFTEPCLSYMLIGKKTIESRFTKNKITPYENIDKDDIVIVKKSGGNVVAYFEIKEVLFFDLKKISIKEIKEKYQNELCVNEEFWDKKKNSNYATLIKIKKINKLKPFSIKKKGMQTWITYNIKKRGE